MSKREKDSEAVRCGSEAVLVLFNKKSQSKPRTHMNTYWDCVNWKISNMQGRNARMK